MSSTPRRRSATPLALGLGLWISLGSGCATLGDRGQPLVPTQHQTRVGPYVVFTNNALAPDDSMVAQLGALRTEVEDTLGVRGDPGEHPIEIYILADRKAFEHFLTFYYPDLPPRRAFFIAQPPRRVVYAFKGDRLEEDIRHEATHALLHLAVGDLPLWLDEGLAEYFETARTGRINVNDEHLGRLPKDLKDGWRPDLPRLEGLKAVRQMTPRDYRESWAWVHSLLADPDAPGGRAALLAYLGEIRDHPQPSGEPRPISARLGVDPARASESLVDHIEATRLAAARLTDPPTTAADATIRLQDAPIEIEPFGSSPPARRRSLLGRLFGRIGSKG